MPACRGNCGRGDVMFRGERYGRSSKAKLMEPELELESTTCDVIKVAECIAQGAGCPNSLVVASSIQFQ